MRTLSENLRALWRLLADLSLDSYLLWRDECREVQGAFERWARSTGGERGPAFDAYLAALDREEAAASVYAMRLQTLGRVPTATRISEHER